MNLILTLNGEQIAPDDIELARLSRAFIISLFTWRRAENGDVPPGQEMQGWWADGLNVVPDKIGSRLWLLQRETITTEVINRARDYCGEALAWLIDDGHAQQIDVRIERLGLDGLALRTQIVRSNGDQIQIGLDQFWQELQGNV